MLAWREGDPIVRRSLSVLWDRADNKAYEAIVVLGRGPVPLPTRCVSFDHVPGVTPNFTVDEWHDCEVAMKADPRVVEALAERGITDLDLVLIDVWTYGHAADAGEVADAAGLGGHLGAVQPDRQPVRQPGVGHEAHRRHEHDGAAGDRPGGRRRRHRRR